MSNKTPQIALILAAGKGTRMGSSTIPKVCFPVEGTPAIIRALKTYQECGIQQNLLVVGTLAGQVVETVGKEYPNTVFAYQREISGTAGAVRTALDATPSMSPDTDIFITVGDRILEASVLEQLVDLYKQEPCDLALLAMPVQLSPGSGRIYKDKEGNACCIIETADIRQRRCRRFFRDMVQNAGSVPAADLRQLLLDRFSAKESKCRKAFPRLFEQDGEISAEEIKELYPESSCLFTMPDGKVLTPDEADALPTVNVSGYITKRKNLQYVLDHLERNNAQQEEYLTDMVRLLRERPEGAVIRSFLERDRDKVLGFNDPEELKKVSEIIRMRSCRSLPEPNPTEFLPVKEYLRQLYAVLEGDKSSSMYHHLEDIYGIDFQSITDHVKQYVQLMELALRDLGAEAPVALVRSPGRVNTMGRHVDHQGGNCNLMTINFETLLVVHPRKDDEFHLHHLNEAEFKPCTFSVAELVSDLPWEDWKSVVDSKKLRELIGQYGVDWSHYVKAAVLRLQKKFHNTPLFGMDLYISGNVPMAAGLSSSSSLLVGAAEAVVCANQLDTFPTQLVSLCGEGEWFVGTRGGAADHAAVKLGARNKVVKVKFFDFGVEEIVDFPDDYAMVICDSGVKARKSGNAKDQFNHRVCCYRLGLKLIKKFFPQYAAQITHLRDVNVDNLHVRPSRIYEILLAMPEIATRRELEAMLGEDLSEYWNTHREPTDGTYPIRSVLLYGLSECARSKITAELLKKKDLQTLGELMKASHDGDRVSRMAEDGTMKPWHYSCDNTTLLNLIEDLNSGIEEKVAKAQLCRVPGAYMCSVPEIDRMVDISNQVDGVAGAQLAGAGLGGCMMILVRKDSVPALKDALLTNYYQKFNIAPAIFECNPIAGAGILKVEEEK